MTDTPDLEATDAQSIDTTTEEDAKLLLADSDDYHRTRRLRQIHKARDAVRKLRNESEHTPDYNYRLQKAVHEYALQIEPIIRDIGHPVEWPERAPWDGFSEYCDALGMSVETYDGRPNRDPELTTASVDETLLVYRYLNNCLADLRPLVEEDETDEWEV